MAEASVLDSKRDKKRGKVLGLMNKICSGFIWNFKNKYQSGIQISQS